MGEDLEIPNCQGAGYGDGNLCERSRMQDRHQALPQWVPRWELGTPHWSVILHEIFLHGAEQGWKEVEHMVCWGCQGSTSEPDLEAGHWISAMELVGYQTSHKEIWDIYHSVYLLRRPPGLPSCRDHLRRRTICHILSSLTGWLHWHGYSAATGEDLESEGEWLPRPNRREPYEDTLRVAHKRVLDTTEVLQGDIKRLSWGTRSASQTCSRSHSKSHTRSRGRSQSRSCSRAHSQSHPQSGSQSRQPRSPRGPPPGRRVTFMEPEVEPNCGEGMEDYLPEPPVSDVKTWLEWQVCQLGMPAWWSELTAIPGVEDLPTRFGTPSLSPKLGRGPSWSGDTLHPLPPNALTEMLSFWMN